MKDPAGGRCQEGEGVHFAVSLMFVPANKPTAADKLNMANDDVYALATTTTSKSGKNPTVPFLLISYKQKADKCSIATQTTGTGQWHTLYLHVSVLINISCKLFCK